MGTFVSATNDPLASITVTPASTACGIYCAATSSGTAKNANCTWVKSNCSINSTRAYLPFTSTRSPALFIEANKRSEEHTSELQSRFDLVCRLLLEKKKPK